MGQNTITAMTSQASLALMKFLADLSRQLGVGKHVYVVGGAVRNFVISQPIKDIDVVIDSVALNGKDSEWFAKQVARNIPAQTKITTNQYGVALLHVVGDWMLGETSLKGEDIEIANARTESYAEGGYTPDKVDKATIYEDTIRREFTFNTLLWRLHDLAEGPDKAEILDLTGCGLRDLQEGVMRCPVSPDKTFTDDPSRMIRAVKFLIKYGFTISLEVKRSIEKNKDKLQNIPHAHLSNMLINTFLREPTGKKALLEMQKLGLLDVIKEIAQSQKPFREALANWADAEARVEFLFDLMDFGLPSGKRLNFLTPGQQQRVRDITVNMAHQEAEQYLQVLTQPGKVLDTKALMLEFNLQGAAVRQIQDVARGVLLDTPALVKDPANLMVRVRMGMEPGVKVASVLAPDPSEGKTFGGGRLYLADVTQDEFVHFTLASRARQIVADGKLLMRPPYQKFGIDAVSAVSIHWGKLVPGVQSTHIKATPEDPLVAIRFKTSTMPSYGYIEEVIWNQDVVLKNVKVIPAAAGAALIRGAESLGGQDQVRYQKRAKTFELNPGDPVLYGKFLNKPGTIKEFGKNDKGDPTVTLEPGKGGQDKEVKLFKVRYDEKRAPEKVAVSVPIYAAYTYLSKTKYRGLDADCDQVQDLIEKLKQGDTGATQDAAKVLAKHPKLVGFSGVVVPAPRSSSDRPSLLALARALVRHGVGTRVEVPVVRVAPVESSRMRRRQGLPGVSFDDHVQSLGVQEHGILPDEDVLLVDDIVTTGATIKAVASRLRQAGHRGSIIGAAAGHAEGDPSEAGTCPVQYVTRTAAVSPCRYTDGDQVGAPKCPQAPEVRARILSRQLGQIGSYTVWLVHGDVLRDEVDIDFTNGGNPAVYGYVPDDEVWVEDFEGPRRYKDMACTLLHEMIEMTLMQQGQAYGDAHDYASGIEDLYRIQSFELDSSGVIPLVTEVFAQWQAARMKRTATVVQRRKLADLSLPTKYNAGLQNLRAKVTYYKDLGNTPDLWVAWFMFYKVGREWADYVIDHLALPAKVAKPVEMAVRLFSKTYGRGKGPPDIAKWYEDNAARLHLLDAARDWPERSEESGLFQLGPFTVHDTIQASPKDLDNAKDIISRAVRAAQGAGVPGFAQMAHGQLFLVGQLARKNWAAWYMPDKDTIYLRPGVRGSSNEESARHLVHELGHRYWAKKLDRDIKQKWVNHHHTMTWSKPDRRVPAVGEVLATIVNGKKVRVEQYDDKGAATLVEATTGAPVGKVDRFQLSGWMQEADHKMSFPTLYAATEAQEHF